VKIPAVALMWWTNEASNVDSICINVIRRDKALNVFEQLLSVIVLLSCNCTALLLTPCHSAFLIQVNLKLIKSFRWVSFLGTSLLRLKNDRAFLNLVTIKTLKMRTQNNLHCTSLALFNPMITVSGRLITPSENAATTTLLEANKTFLFWIFACSPQDFVLDLWGYQHCDLFP
jgi:hypothetical protein